MTKETATRVHELVMNAVQAIDDSLAALQNDAGEEECHEYRLAAGHILDDLMVSFLKPIYRQHEDLIPIQLDRRYLNL